MSRQQQPTAWLEDSVALAQVPIQVRNMFENLKRHDSISRFIRELDAMARFQQHIDITVNIATDVPAILRSKERFIRSVATPHIDDKL